MYSSIDIVPILVCLGVCSLDMLVLWQLLTKTVNSILSSLIELVLGNIGNIVSLNLLYRSLVILLDWLLPRLAPDRLIDISTLF